MLLADTSFNWSFLMDTLVAIGTFGALIIAIIAVSRKQEVKVQQPISVEVIEQLHEQFASREGFEEHVRNTAEEFRRLRAENKHDREEIAKKSSEQVAGVYDRIEDVRKELGGKIDSLPERVINTLKTTGAI